MPEVESAYYHSLAGFEALFQTGRPILTFHKFGPRPRGARLKGLYLSEKLFSRQLAELAQAGYETSSLSNLGDGKAKRSIVLTIDDGFCNVVEYGLPLLTQYHAKAILFLVADRLGQTNDWDIPHGEAPASLMTPSQVRDWLAAGHEIGSHTLTHAWLTRVPVAQAREEISGEQEEVGGPLWPANTALLLSLWRLESGDPRPGGGSGVFDRLHHGLRRQRTGC